MNLFGESITLGTFIFLILALGLALSFEFVNGFHDTANAVATVIYTNTLKPTVAVVWSGIFNLLGVIISSGAVAFSVTSLLPVELILNVGSAKGFSMVFSLLISAIIWNLGTWYLGLPASSSHTLVGSIIGVGLANSIIANQGFGNGVDWSKTEEVFASLLISPIIGFVCAAVLLLLVKRILPQPELFKAPEEDQAPPSWIRALLIITCTGVSFAHGSNDGQKGMGLILLILIGILPGMFALNMNIDRSTIEQIVSSSQYVITIIENKSSGALLSNPEASQQLSTYIKPKVEVNEKTFAALAMITQEITDKLQGKTSLKDFSQPERLILRNNIYLVSETINKLNNQNLLTNQSSKESLTKYNSQINQLTQFIPFWVKLATAIALGGGTMIGWKRIVVTVGEKIGKEHLSYAQGASAEVVAMGTIAAGDYFGLPVSTTHILSSGVAGTMAANGSGLQFNTIRNLLLAWVLTLPVCLLLSAVIFFVSWFVASHLFGMI